MRKLQNVLFGIVVVVFAIILFMRWQESINNKQTIDYMLDTVFVAVLCMGGLYILEWWVSAKREIARNKRFADQQAQQEQVEEKDNKLN